MHVNGVWNSFTTVFVKQRISIYSKSLKKMAPGILINVNETSGEEFYIGKLEQNWRWRKKFDCVCLE